MTFLNVFGVSMVLKIFGVNKNLKAEMCSIICLLYINRRPRALSCFYFTLN